MRPPKTVRVRIPVAITDDGAWEALGGSNAKGGLRGCITDLVGVAKDMFDPPIEIHIVEADIPVPAKPKRLTFRASKVQRRRR
jgi:hypothetical protein